MKAPKTKRKELIENIKLISKQQKQKELFIEEIKNTGLIQVTCQKVGIPRSTLYRWRKDDYEFAQKLEDAKICGEGMINDLAKSRLISKIKSDDFKAISFWLKHKDPEFADPWRFPPSKTEKNTGLSEERKKGIIERMKRWKECGKCEECYE